MCSLSGPTWQKRPLLDSDGGLPPSGGPSGSHGENGHPALRVVVAFCGIDLSAEGRLRSLLRFVVTLSAFLSITWLWRIWELSLGEHS
jgi:hypothetical protein